MFKNYFKIAFRNLWRNKEFTIINIAGLALGIAVFVLIIQYVAFEWNANRYNKNYKSLTRVSVQRKDGAAEYYLPPGFAQPIKQQIPAIENAVRVADRIGGGVLSYTGQTEQQNKSFREDYIYYVEGNFLNVFSFPIVSGTASLAEPKTLALSETISKKIFGTTDAAGKTIMVSNQFGNTLYTVKAVYRLPETSDINPEVVLSLHTLENAANRDGNDWADPNGTDAGMSNIYLQLKKDADRSKTQKAIQEFLVSVNPESKDDKIFLQPFSELHLAPSFDYPLQTFGSFLLVALFSAVAVLILLIAWVNYINLSTAQALNRAREVGVRKVLGAARMQLAFQYLTETLLLTLTASAVAVLLVAFFQNTFNEFTGKQLSMSILNVGWFWAIGIVLIISGSLLSGGYVSFVLTSFNPISTIRGKLQTSLRGIALRKGLVVFQFTISIVFIIATVTLYRQLQYMKTENLGMKLEQLLVIQGPTVSSEDQAAKNVSFKNSLTQLPFVKKQAASNNIPGVGYNFSANGIVKLNAPLKDDEKKSYTMFICDQNFFDTYGIQLLQGRSFTADEAERSWNNIHSIIVNEKAARLLGFDPKENIIGKKVKWGSDFEIVGLVKDYHHLSLREAIQPTIYLGSVSYSFFTVQTDTRDMQSKISTIRNLFNNTFAGNPFEYFFADERYNQQYESEQKLGSVFVAAAGVAIFIACMGLFGLVAFSARQRIKEIGIRKVLGASIFSITQLLSKDFLLLVAIAFVIASPIAWYGMNKWLQDFAYRINISWWVFLVAGAVALFIALATVSFQAIKAAVANPVKSLRTE
jgi:putative ABC transport system permease protein